MNSPWKWKRIELQKKKNCYRIKLKTKPLHSAILIWNWIFENVYEIIAALCYCLAGLRTEKAWVKRRCVFGGATHGAATWNMNCKRMPIVRHSDCEETIIHSHTSRSTFYSVEDYLAFVIETFRQRMGDRENCEQNMCWQYKWTIEPPLPVDRW